MRVAGIMSGTSLDGIDVAIVDIKGSRVTTVAASTTPYKQATREAILNARTPAELSRLNVHLGELYAKAVEKLVRNTKTKIDLIGCHGQTVHHEGRGRQPNTLQIGEASVIAERLNVPVVSDFRARDIAAGGLGAPLVPLADYLLFRSKTKNRVALNIGGIANITILPKAAKLEQIKAFDTGPGNMVIDQLTAIHTRGKQTYDRNGTIAAANQINQPLLNELVTNPFYKTKPPKTAGREQYGHDFVAKLQSTRLPTGTLIATATALTAATIAKAIHQFAPNTTELIAAGGGIHNPPLMSQLQAFLPKTRLTTTAEFGVAPDAKEAIAFALLAYRTWHRKPGNLPSATGATHPVILGKLTLS